MSMDRSRKDSSREDTCGRDVNWRRKSAIVWSPHGLASQTPSFTGEYTFEQLMYQSRILRGGTGIGARRRGYNGRREQCPYGS